MTIYTLHIYDRNGTCLYNAEWNRKQRGSISSEEEQKLMYGMLYSVKSLVDRISPVDFKNGFQGFATNKYRLHFYETATGVKFVLTTDLASEDMRDVLQQIYVQVYVQYVVRNPECDLNEPIRSVLFRNKLDEFMNKLPNFTSKA